ncbi:mucin-17-like [Ostrea edulis]|uniref:mucin-17-like n=1 Tax=Ostrea edulis TaxID=37623 RepID=UPI0024AF51AE|nr:mucin-17-like [Ostrea edulis]
MNRRQHLGRLRDYRSEWPHMSSLYSGGSAREEEEQKYVDPGMMFDNVYEDPSEPYGAYKFYMAPREEFVIQSEPHLYPTRAVYKDDDDRTSGYATSGGSSSFKDGSTRRILLCVLLIFLLIGAIIAAVTMAVLISHQRRMKPLSPDSQQQDVLESNIRIANRTYKAEHGDPSSKDFRILETEFCEAMDAMFLHSDSSLNEDYKGCKVLSFRYGSVIARYLLMFSWKDKKPTGSIVDTVKDFLQDTIPKIGIWNPLLLDGDSVNIYPVEINEFEPTRKSPEIRLTSDDIGRETVSSSIVPVIDSLSRTASVQINDESTVGVPPEATKKDILSKVSPSFTTISAKTKEVYIMSEFDDNVEKLYSSQSYLMVESEITPSVSLSSKFSQPAFDILLTKSDIVDHLLDDMKIQTTPSIITDEKASIDKSLSLDISLRKDEIENILSGFLPPASSSSKMSSGVLSSVEIHHPDLEISATPSVSVINIGTGDMSRTIAATPSNTMDASVDVTAPTDDLFGRFLLPSSPSTKNPLGFPSWVESKTVHQSSADLLLSDGGFGGFLFPFPMRKESSTEILPPNFLMASAHSQFIPYSYSVGDEEMSEHMGKRHQSTLESAMRSSLPVHYPKGSTEDVAILSSDLPTRSKESESHSSLTLGPEIGGMFENFFLRSSTSLGQEVTEKTPSTELIDSDTSSEYQLTSQILSNDKYTDTTYILSSKDGILSRYFVDTKTKIKGLYSTSFQSTPSTSSESLSFSENNVKSTMVLSSQDLTSRDITKSSVYEELSSPVPSDDTLDSLISSSVDELPLLVKTADDSSLFSSFSSTSRRLPLQVTTSYYNSLQALLPTDSGSELPIEEFGLNLISLPLLENHLKSDIVDRSREGAPDPQISTHSTKLYSVIQSQDAVSPFSGLIPDISLDGKLESLFDNIYDMKSVFSPIVSTVLSSSVAEEDKQTLQTTHTASLTQPFDFQSSVADLSVYKSNDTHMKTFSDVLGDVSDLLSTFILEDKQLTNILQSSHSIAEETSSSLTKTSMTPNILNVGFMSTTALTDEKYILPTKSLGYNTKIVVSSHISLSEEISISSDLNPNQLTKSSVLQTSPIPSIADVSPQSEQTMESYASFVTDISTSQSESVYPLTNFDQSSVYSSGVLHQESFPSSTKLKSSSDFSSGSLYTTNPVMSSLQQESTSTSDETSQYASHGLSQKFDEQFSDTVFQNTMDKIYSTALDGIMESAYLRPPQTLTDFESTTPVFASTLKSLQTMISENTSEKSQSSMFEAQQLSSIIDDESSKFDLIPSNVRATDMNDTYTAAMIATTSVLDEMNIMSDGTAASLTSGSVSTQTYLPRSINPDSSHTDEQTKVFMTISNKIENQNSTWSGSYTDKSSITDLDFKSIDITATTPDVSEYEKMTASITAVSSSTVTKEQNMATGFDLLSSIHSPFETFYPRSISSETVEALDSFSINGLMTESPIDTVNSAVHPEATELNSEIVQMPSIGQISTDVDLNSQMFPQRTTDSIQLQSVTASSIAVMNDSFSVHLTSSLFLNDLGKQTNIPFLDQSDLFDASVTEVSSSFSTVMTSQANMPTPDFLTAPSVNKTVFMQSEIDTLISFYSSKEFLNKSVGFDANRITELENDFKTEIHVRDPLNSATWISKSLTNVLDLQPSKLPFSDISSDHVVKFSNSALPNTDSLGLKNDVLTSAIMDSIISTPIDMLPVIVQSSDLTTTSSSYFVSKSTVDHIKDFESQETKLQSHSSLLVPSMYDFSNSSVGHLYDEMQINGSLSMSSLYTTSELPDILSAIPAGKVYETQITVEPLFTSSIHAINTPIDASVLSNIPEIREDILESIAVADPFHSNTVSSSELTSEVSASFALLGSLSSVLLHVDNENTATEGVKLSSLSTSYISNHESVTLESGLAPSATDVSHATEILTTTAFSLNSEIWRPDGDIKSETSYPSSVSYIPPIINHHVFSASNIDQSTISSSVQSSLTVTTYPLTKVLTALASSTPELSINSSNSIPFPFPLPSSKYDPSLIETLPVISTQVVPETSSSNLTLDPKINVTRSRFDIIYDTSNFENSSYVKTVHFTASETLNETFSNTFVISDGIHTMNSIEHSLFNTPLIDLYSSIPTFDTISISKSSSNAFSLTPSEENKSQTVHFSDSLLDSFNLNSILMSHTAVNLILSSSLFEFSTVIDDSIPKVKPTGADSAALQTPVGVELNASSTMVSEVQSLTPLVSPYNMSIDSPLEFIHVNSSHDLDSHTFEPNRTEISISPTQMKSYSLSVMNNAVQNQTLLVQATSMDEIKDSVFYVNDHSHSLSIGPQTVDTINLIVPTRVDSQMSSNIRSEILYQTSTSLIIPYEISQDILFKTVKENLSSNINPQILKSETTNLMTKPLSPSHVNSYSLSFMTSAVLSQLPPVQSTSYFSSDAIFFDVNKENSSLEVFNATITNLISPTLMESIITTSNVPYQANDETSTSLIYPTLIESFMSSVLSNEILSQTPPLLNTTYNTSHDLLFDMNKENSTSEIRPLAIGDNSTSLILPTLVESFMPSVMTNEVQTTSLLDTSYDKSHDVLFDMNKENSTLEIDPLAIDENSTFLKSQTLVEPYKSSLISNEILSQTPSLLDTSYDQSHDVLFDMNKENSTSEIRPLAIDDNSTSLILPTLVESFMPSVMSNEILSQTPSLLNTTYNTSLDVLFDMNNENSTSEISQMTIHNNSTIQISPTLVESFMPSVMSNEILSQTPSSLTISSENFHDFLSENRSLDINTIAFNDNLTNFISSSVESYMSSVMTNKSLSQTPYSLNTSSDTSHDFLLHMNNDTRSLDISPLTLDNNSTNLTSPNSSLMANETPSQTSLFSTSYNTSSDSLFYMNRENSTLGLGQLVSDDNSMILISPTLVESHIPSVMTNEILSQTPSVLSMSSDNSHDFLYEKRSLDINSNAFDDMSTNLISSTSNELYMPYTMTTEILSQASSVLTTSSDIPHFIDKVSHSLDASLQYVENNNLSNMEPKAISSTQSYSSPIVNIAFSSQFSPYVKPNDIPVTINEIEKVLDTSNLMTNSITPSLIQSELFSKTQLVQAISHDASIFNTVKENNSLDMSPLVFHDNISTYLMNTITPTRVESYSPSLMSSKMLSPTPLLQTTSYDTLIDSLSLAPTLGTTAYDKSNDTLIHENIEGHSLHLGPQIFSVNTTRNQAMTDVSPTRVESVISSAVIAEIPNEEKNSLDLVPDVFDSYTTTYRYPSTEDVSSTQVNLPSVETSEIQSQTPSVETSDIQALSPSVETSEIQSQTPSVENSKIQSQTPSVETSEIQSQTPSVETSEIQSQTPSVETSEIQSQTPIVQTTPYDAFKDFLFKVKEESPSLNLGSQALDTSVFDTSINSTPYLLRSSLFFTLIEESSLHDLAIQSSSYESFQTVQTYSDMTSSQNNENQNISIISQGESVVDSFELFGSLSGGVSDTNVLPNLIVTNILPTRSVKPFDTVWTSHWSSALAPGNLSPITIATDFTHPTPSLGYSSLISVTPYSVLLPKLSTDTSSPTNESDTIQQKVKGSHGSSNFNLSKSLKQNDLMANHALDKQDYYKAVNASDFFVYPTSGMKENVSMNVNGSSKSRIYSPAADIDEDSIRSDILWPFNEFDHLSPHQHFAEDSYIEISLSLDSLTQLSIDLDTDWPSGVTSSSSYAEMHTRLPSAKTFPQFDESLQISNKVFQKGLSRELATDILLDTMLDIGFSSKVLAIPVSQQSSKFPTVISSNTEMQKTFSSAGNFDGPFSYIDDKDTTIKSHNPPLDNTVSTSVSHTPTHSIKGTVFSTSDILSSMDYDTKKVSPISTIPINSSLMHNSHKQLPNSKLSEVGNFIQSSEFVYGAAVDKSEVISTSEKGGGTGSFTNASFALHTQTLLPSLENFFGFIPLSNENKNLDSRPTLTKSSSLSLDILSDRLGSISELSFDRSSINVDSSVSPNVEDEALLLSTENSVNNTYPTQYLDPTNSVRSVFQTQTSSKSFFGAKTEDTGNTRLFSSILSENFKETRRIFATSTVTDFDTKSTIKSLSSLEKPFIVSNSDLIHSSKVAIGTTLSQKADRHDGISEVGNHIMSSIVSSLLNRDTKAQLTNTVSEIHISSTLTEKKPPNFPSNIVPSSTKSYTYQSPIYNNANTKHSQTETSIAALKFPSNINSYTVTKSRSSVNNVLFTAANDYDYYATAYDFITDNLEDTLSDSVESSSASTSLTSFDDTKSYSDTPPLIPIQPTAISSGKANNAKIQDTIPSESGVVKGYPIVLDLIKPSKTQRQTQISPKLNSISGETFNPNNHAISSLGFLETPVRMRSSQATQIIKDTIMPSLQRFPGEDVTETTPLGTMIKQSPTSSIISMSSEDPFAAFFGAGPAIPQWVLDMLGSVHESPKSSANYHFRH